MAYATAAQLFDHHDIRTISRLASDSGGELNRQDLATCSKVTSALTAASGEVDAALLAGSRYSPSDLSGLSGNAAAHLVQMTCDITMSRLFRRRPALDPDLAKSYHEVAREHLEALRKGVNVFNLTSQQAKMHPTVDGPTSLEYQQNNLLPDRTKHYYPARESRLPTIRT